MLMVAQALTRAGVGWISAQKAQDRQSSRGETISVKLSGSATCKDMPALLTALESLPADRNVQLAGLDDWLKRDSRTGRLIEIVGSMRAGAHPRIVSMFRRYQTEARNAAWHMKKAATSSDSRTIPVQGVGVVPICASGKRVTVDVGFVRWADEEKASRSCGTPVAVSISFSIINAYTRGHLRHLLQQFRFRWSRRNGV